MPHINLSISGYDPESLRGSHIRTQDTENPGKFNNTAIGWTCISSQLETEEGYQRILELWNKNIPEEGTYLQGASAS